MTPAEALNILIGIINQAEFKGSIGMINTMGQKAEEARLVLEALIKSSVKPVENNQ